MRSVLAVANLWIHTKRNQRDSDSPLSLDITGAYPRVNRDRLLEALANKGVPAWIIKFVASWLWKSHTYLHLPGRRPESFRINIGIPQGSSLSPILFLFFAAGMLEISFIGSFARNAYLFSFVDDTYIVVRSESFKKNCEILAILHERVQDWARANDVEFAPHKYGLLHFERGNLENRCRELPRIHGLTPQHLEPPENYKVPHLRILGVIVDTQLKWGPHIDEVRNPPTPPLPPRHVCTRPFMHQLTREIKIEEKVRRQQYNFWHISRVQTGPKLQHMRQLYMAKVLPVFSYACGAWYIPHEEGRMYSISAGDIKRLESLHYDCLRDVAGGISGTSREVLFKELHIHRMSIFLEKVALAQRARELGTPQQEASVTIRNRAWKSKERPHDQLVKLQKRHPYHELDEAARELLKTALKSPELPKNAHRSRPSSGKLHIRQCIKWLANSRAEAASRAAWEDHRMAFISGRAGRVPAAYSDPAGWGSHNLDRYANLPRLQSSMLFQCRTEVVGVNLFLYKTRSKQDIEAGLRASPACHCGHPKQTVEHLFSYCPDLEEARSRHLVLAVGTKNVDELLSNYPAEASAFAVMHFNIRKAEGVELYLPAREGLQQGAGKGTPTRGAQQAARAGTKRPREHEADETETKAKTKAKTKPKPRTDHAKRQRRADKNRRQREAGTSKCQRRGDQEDRVWKKQRAEDVGRPPLMVVIKGAAHHR